MTFYGEQPVGAANPDIKAMPRRKEDLAQDSGTTQERV
jgi:hypothetical protein